MDKEKDYVYSEPEEIYEGKTLNIIVNEFNNLLKETDSEYMEKIFFNVSYNHYHQFNQSGEYYKINIFPCMDGFNSQKYFKNKFETKSGQKRLAKFAEENGIGLITY